MCRLAFCVCVAVALWAESTLSQSVFSEPVEAHMLLRSRRANSFLEELKPPSMERECVEETCNFEEAIEIFKTREATLEFWTKYSDGNQCETHKCEYGTCVDMFKDYACRCNPGYEGKYCDYLQTATNCSVNNGDCDHECSESEDGTKRMCSCVIGYTLHDDDRKCVPKGARSCGQLLIGRSSYSKPVDGLMPWMVGGDVGKKGESPWQVLVQNAKGRFHCGGVLIDESWVLTAAHCLENNLRLRVRLGDYERFRNEGTEVTLPVVGAFKHPDYDGTTGDNDIALLRLDSPAPFSEYVLPACLPSRRLAENVLHRNGTPTVVTGWGKDSIDSARFSSALNVIRVPLVSRDVCAGLMSHNITNNMLCGGILGQRIDACEGDSGGPMVTLHADTWFLVGLVSWGEGCGREDKLGIYTKVSNYNEWIDTVRENWDKRGPPPEP
ncbi:vitamin K-dependent protein C [Nerophis ophidion]|uniref:vitamin K-dependent protein C n=1 Tax=Nerophis ophidion TaxID=159077 RepID=UPI002ADF35CE|nr:vitamin K-dependent protein C [Nerophis ophidion]XP_061776657.1 vitamin K-dependent protein C [Nerophis ophidion]